jgi:serine/threonine protein kinase/Flp pilus assembly protein TadD
MIRMSNAESKSGQKEQRLLIHQPGLRRLGKYELIARIGEGGMAEVYLARQRGPMDFEKVVVVKTIHPHLGRKKKFIDMLLDEARIAARLKHPCVVDIYDLGVEGDTYFIAMEHLPGETLLSVLRACVKQRQLDVPCTARIIADVADGLQAAHDLKDNIGHPLELVHRDITPGNIVVLYTGQVKILDFGIAKARGRLAEETDADHFKGKLGYISPEQVKGQKVDRRSDIFSLGVVMWESLALRRLFRKNTPAAAADAILKETIPPPSKYRSSVPPKLDSICMRALARDPDERYSNASEMQEDIERFLAAGSFRPHKAAIRKYMHEIFAERIEEREQLVHRVVVATSEFLVSSMPRYSSEGDIDNSGDEYPVVEISSGSSPRIQPPKGRTGTPSKQGEEATPAGAGERLAGDHEGTALPPLDQPAGAGRSKRVWAGVGGAVVLALVIIVAVAMSGGGGESQPVASKAQEVPQTTTGSQGTAAGRQDAEQTDSPEGAGKVAENQTDTAGQDSAQDDRAGRDDAGDGDKNVTAATTSADDEQKRRRVRKADPNALYNEGIKLYLSGNLEPAKDKFRAALKAQSSYAAAYRGLGKVYERQGKKKQAADAYRKYLRLAPNASDKQSIEKQLAAMGG